MNNLDKSKIINSFMWKLFERAGVQTIQFIIQLLLARLLFPKDYGTVSLITIFIAVANVFVESGFNTALIQKNKVDQLDYSTVFTISFTIALFLYIVLWFASPYIANFYDLKILSSLIKALALTLIIGSINSIQIAYISRNFNFKTLFKCSIISVLLSGILGILLASSGYGVWSLIIQQLVQKIIVTILLQYKIKLSFSFNFSLNRAKQLFGFGSRLMLSNLINTIYINSYGLIIGKLYDKEMLGYYNRADQFPNIVMSNLNGAMQSVILPALSSEQNDKKIVKGLMKRTLSTSSFIAFPMMLGLAACANEVVVVMLTEKWLPCVPFFQILCISYAFYPIHTINLQAINAIGRSDIFLKLEIIKKIVGIIILLISIPYGVMVMVLLQPIDNLIACYINASPSKKLLNYGFMEQINDILPILLCSGIMTFFVMCINLLGISPILSLIIKVFVGITIYIGISLFMKIESLHYIIRIAKSILKR